MALPLRQDGLEDHCDGLGMLRPGGAEVVVGLQHAGVEGMEIPCRDVRGFRTCLEDRCGWHSRSSGPAGGRSWRRRRAGWPVLRTQRCRGVGWGPRGLCPRTTAVLACNRRFPWWAGRPEGRWRSGCQPGWRRRWWREWRPSCLQCPGAGTSPLVVDDSCRIWTCGRDLPPCRGRNSTKAGCPLDVVRHSQYWDAYRCTGRRSPGWDSCASSGQSPGNCGTGGNGTSSSWSSSMSSASWWLPWSACQAGVQSG